MQLANSLEPVTMIFDEQEWIFSQIADLESLNTFSETGIFNTNKVVMSSIDLASIKCDHQYTCFLNGRIGLEVWVGTKKNITFGRKVYKISKVLKLAQW